MLKRLIGIFLIAAAIYLFTEGRIVAGGILFLLGGIFFGGSFGDVSVNYGDNETSFSSGDSSFSISDGGSDGGGGGD